jgi:hypothetical protein
MHLMVFSELFIHHNARNEQCDTKFIISKNASEQWQTFKLLSFVSKDLKNSTASFEKLN